MLTSAQRQRLQEIAEWDAWNNALFTRQPNCRSDKEVLAVDLELVTAGYLLIGLGRFGRLRLTDHGRAALA